MRPDYDDKKLTIAVLRNLLLYHGVDYSTCRTRADFLQLFNAEVRYRVGPQLPSGYAGGTHADVSASSGGPSVHTQVCMFLHYRVATVTQEVVGSISISLFRLQYELYFHEKPRTAIDHGRASASQIAHHLRVATHCSSPCATFPSGSTTQNPILANRARRKAPAARSACRPFEHQRHGARMFQPSARTRAGSTTTFFRIAAGSGSCIRHGNTPRTPILTNRTRT